MSSYTNATDESSSNEDQESSYSVKPVKPKISKRKNVGESKTGSKKTKIGKQSESYKDIFMDLISKGKVENDVLNTLTMKEGNNSYTFKCPVAPHCEDYYVIQHYKISTIQDIPSDERWKHAEASIKIHTSTRDTKDSNISNKINDVVREILDRFSADPKKKIIKNTKK
ncbi:uncharacterized protein LOC132951264 [Metopolophium dirhodum]|uniref:uncharacterized protein LOC132951264 n=1 Tax=Metopolophium dirhodum TaxID=44670 RepID=UPI0029900233|nr:uncharacterized protein LOC132951264 [Metopolophium dirhodum]